VKVIDASDAKTHLPALLGRVARGETITITSRGVPAAMLVPIRESNRRLAHAEIVQGMRELRRRVKPGAMSVREMIEEGR